MATQGTTDAAREAGQTYPQDGKGWLRSIPEKASAGQNRAQFTPRPWRNGDSGWSLILAAPELYEACLNARERLKDACQHGYVAAKTLQQLDAALAKAEGR